MTNDRKWEAMREQRNAAKREAENAKEQLRDIERELASAWEQASSSDAESITRLAKALDDCGYRPLLEKVVARTDAYKAAYHKESRSDWMYPGSALDFDGVDALAVQTSALLQLIDGETADLSGLDGLRGVWALLRTELYLDDRPIEPRKRRQGEHAVASGVMAKLHQRFDEELGELDFAKPLDSDSANAVLEFIKRIPLADWESYDDEVAAVDVKSSENKRSNSAHTFLQTVEQILKRLKQLDGEATKTVRKNARDYLRQHRVGVEGAFKCAVLTHYRAQIG